MARPKQLRINLDDPSAPERTALNELYHQSAKYRTSAAYYSLMKFITRFSHYSPYNCMLLHIQNPEVTYVATPSQWMKRFKREVKPNSRPLLILAPRCPVLFVYDLADTEGEELPERWQNPFEANGILDPRLWQRTLANCNQDGIFIDSTDRFPLLHEGTPYRRRSIQRLQTAYQDHPFDFLINIIWDQSIHEAYAKLVHELAHIYSGHRGPIEGGRCEERIGLTDEHKELEANSISYLVCRRKGIETESEQYLAKFADGSCQMPAINVETVLKVTQYIESMGNKILLERKKKPE